jgi:formylglycine-generating enzyme required for sulfatase activity
VSHVFISYSKEDREYAQRLRDHLLQRGFDVWIDEVIDPGDDWWRYIRQAIRDCAAFVVVMTPEAESSHWVGVELLHALEYKRPVFPLLRAGDENPFNSDVWSRIVNVQFTDVRHGRMPPARFYDRMTDRGVPHGRRGRVVTPLDIAGTLWLPPDVSDVLPPPFDWCLVPAGPVTVDYGSWNLARDKYSLRERRPFDLPAFAVARFPVTVGQFRAFVEAGDGYADARWWAVTDAAAAWAAAGGRPLEPPFGGEDLPCTRVNWYEALAFTRWLSSRTGVHVDLPTEQQWQRAAQGDDDRHYPWGATFDRARCNTSESGIWRLTPVERYPEGASLYGVTDLAGNVWEWTLSQWTRDSVNLRGTADRVVRGGSWLDYHDSARAAARSVNNPDGRGLSLGFRVVALPERP